MQGARIVDWHRASAWAALTAAFSACFARTYGYSLVWDDSVLRNLNDARASLPALLLAPQQTIMDAVENARAGAEVRVDSYRPLQSLSHVLDVRWLGASAGAMHLHNVALGAINVVLAYWVACRLGVTRGAALCAAGVFALHPLQVEPVAYVSARGDLLAALFALLALGLALPAARAARGAWKGVLASAACYLLSLLAKEAYVLLPLVIATVALLDRTLRARAAVLGAQLVALLAYAALRVTAMGRAADNLGAGPSALLHAPAVLLQYVRSYLLPLDVSIAREYDPALLLIGIACALATCAIWVVLVRTQRSGHAPGARLIAISLVWIAVLLAPSLVVIADTHVLADRYFYLPLLGATLLCCGIWSELRGTLARRLVAAGAFGWALLALGVTFAQVPVWRDNRTLYTHATRVSPHSSFAHYQLGYLEASEGHWQRAAELFAHAIELDPRNVRAHNNLGVALLHLRRPGDAAAVLQGAVALAPGLNYRALYNLGLAQRDLGDERGACASFRSAQQINAHYALATAMLAECDARALSGAALR